MKLMKISPVVLAVLTAAACNHSKKSVATATPAATIATTPATTNSTTASPEVAGPVFVSKSSKGVVAPGDEQLTAIQAKYKDVTMQTLSDGYAIYTGVCTNCHGAKNIYRHPEQSWPGILADMAVRAKITDVQKDAVYKYVLAVKATQPKAGQ